MFRIGVPGKELKAIEIDLHCCWAWQDFAISFALPCFALVSKSAVSHLECLIGGWANTLPSSLLVCVCAMHTDKLQKEKPNAKESKASLASLPLMKIGSCCFSGKRQINKPNMATAWPKACATAARQRARHSHASTTAQYMPHTHTHTDAHLK